MLLLFYMQVSDKLCDVTWCKKNLEFHLAIETWSSGILLALSKSWFTFLLCFESGKWARKVTCHEAKLHVLFRQADDPFFEWGIWGPVWTNIGKYEIMCMSSAMYLTNEHQVWQALFFRLSQYLYILLDRLFIIYCCTCRQLFWNIL